MFRNAGETRRRADQLPPTEAILAPMPADDPRQLRPATLDEIAESLSVALLYDGRRRVHHAGDMTERITARYLIEHLEGSGFVLMKRLPARGRSVPGASLWKEPQSR